MSWLRQIKGSLYWRLIGIFLLTGVSIILVVGTYFHFFIKPEIETFQGNRAKFHLEYVLEDIGIPPNLERVQEIAESQQLKVLVRGQGLNWSTDDELLHETKEKHVRHVARGLNIVRFAGGMYAKIQHEDWVLYFGPGPFSLDKTETWVLWVILAFILLILTCNYAAVRWLFRPIQDIRQGAEKISHGALNVRIHTQRGGELGDLVHSVNTMADSLQQMLEGKRELLLAISHELRTPVTRAKVALALVENKSLHQNLEDELNCMEDLIAALLESERLNTPHVRLNKEYIDLNLLLKDIAAEYAYDWFELHLPENTGEASAFVDPLRIGLLLRNLINNAEIHRNNGQVEVLLKDKTDAVEITVKDHGVGISEDNVQLVTEPFFRADKSRTRNTGGFGLGLYLAKLITEAHDGGLTISSDLGVGTEVVISLPK